MDSALDGRLLFERLVQGDEQACSEMVRALHEQQQASLPLICELLTDAFHRIGDAWQCSKISIYREHIASQIGFRLIQSLRMATPWPAGSTRIAIGCTPEKDPYVLANAMVELILRGQGWRSYSLGNNLPLRELKLAIQEYQPRLCWVSASYTENEARLHEELIGLGRFAESYNTLVICGGRAIVPGRLDNPVKFIDDLRQLSSVSR